MAFMKLTVKCFATLAKYTPQGAESYEAPGGMTAGELIVQLGMELGDVKILFVNGTHANPDRVLADGDRVGLFPAIGGG